MILADRIQQQVQQLPVAFQTEVLNFVEYLLIKSAQEKAHTWTDRSLENTLRVLAVEYHLRKSLPEEDSTWSELSLQNALVGMEEEENNPLYTTSDLKMVFS